MPGDAATTVNNILASESLFRLGFVSDLIGQVVSILYALVLYKFLKPVDDTLYGTYDLNNHPLQSQCITWGQFVKDIPTSECENQLSNMHFYGFCSDKLVPRIPPRVVMLQILTGLGVLTSALALYLGFN